MSFVIGFVLGGFLGGVLVALFRLERCLLLLEEPPPEEAATEATPTLPPADPIEEHLGRRVVVRKESSDGVSDIVEPPAPRPRPADGTADD